jgi:hypothetical protein
MLGMLGRLLVNRIRLMKMGRIRLCSMNLWVSDSLPKSSCRWELVWKLTCVVRRLGVCAGICAWNGSHVLAAWKMAPAMAAGNTFVLKSSEKSPLALAAYGDLIKEVCSHHRPKTSTQVQSSREPPH